MPSFDEYKKIEMVTCKITEAEDHPNADKLYVLKVDTGSEVRQVVAGIKNFYTKEELVGKTVVLAKNIDKATIRGVESEGMVLAAKDNEKLSLVTIEKEVSLGSRVT